MRTIALLCFGLIVGGCAVFGNRSPTAFNVFFHSGSSELTADATSIVDSAAVAIREGHPRLVIVSAGTSPGDNLNFAEARFKSVQAVLVADGVSPALIARATLTEAPAELGPTAERRVEIKLVDNAP